MCFQETSPSNSKFASKLSKNQSKMSAVTLAETSNRVEVPHGLPRRAAGTVHAEDEDECRCVRPGWGSVRPGWDCSSSHPHGWPVSTALSGLPRENAEAGEPAVYRGLPRRSAGVMNPEDESDDETSPRPLEPVAAVTYAEARARAEKTAKATAALEKAFKNNPSDAASYKEAEWNEVPETEATTPISATWYSCVKRYRFIQYGGAMGGPKLIIEVELMGGTTLRYILKLSQVKGVITKSNTRDTHGYQRIEEVIIDQRASHTCYAPEQVKLKFAGTVSALAFQMDLMSAL